MCRRLYRWKWNLLCICIALLAIYFLLTPFLNRWSNSDPLRVSIMELNSSPDLYKDQQVEVQGRIQSVISSVCHTPGPLSLLLVVDRSEQLSKPLLQISMSDPQVVPVSMLVFQPSEHVEEELRTELAAQQQTPFIDSVLIQGTFRLGKRVVIPCITPAPSKDETVPWMYLEVTRIQFANGRVLQ